LAGFQVTFIGRFWVTAEGIAISNAGITSTQSELMSFNGIVAAKGHSLGSVTFSTGALISGSISAGGTFSSVGLTLVVTGNGSQGVPKGAIFNGAFTGPITWMLVSKHGANVTYTLSGTISGDAVHGENGQRHTHGDNLLLQSTA
jgi:hypothetical protein